MCEAVWPSNMHSCDDSLNAIDTESSLSISVVGALYTVCIGSRNQLCNPATVRSRLLYCGALSYLTMHIASWIFYATRNWAYMPMCASRCVSIAYNYKSRVDWIPCFSPSLTFYVRSVVFRVSMNESIRYFMALHCNRKCKNSTCD